MNRFEYWNDHDFGTRTRTASFGATGASPTIASGLTLQLQRQNESIDAMMDDDQQISSQHASMSASQASTVAAAAASSSFVSLLWRQLHAQQHASSQSPSMYSPSSYSSIGSPAMPQQLPKSPYAHQRHQQRFYASIEPQPNSISSVKTSYSSPIYFPFSNSPMSPTVMVSASPVTGTAAAAAPLVSVGHLHGTTATQDRDGHTHGKLPILQLDDALLAYVCQFLPLRDVVHAAQLVNKRLYGAIWNKKYMWNSILVDFRLKSSVLQSYVNSPQSPLSMQHQMQPGGMPRGGQGAGSLQAVRFQAASQLSPHFDVGIDRYMQIRAARSERESSHRFAAAQNDEDDDVLMQDDDEDRTELNDTSSYMTQAFRANHQQQGLKYLNRAENIHTSCDRIDAIGGFMRRVGKNITRLRIQDPCLSIDAMLHHQHGSLPLAVMTEIHKHHFLIHSVISECGPQLQELALQMQMLPDALVLLVLQLCRRLKKLAVHRGSQRWHQHQSMVHVCPTECSYCSQSAWQLDVNTQRGWLPRLKTFKLQEKTQAKDKISLSQQILRWIPTAAPELQKLELEVPLHLFEDMTVFRAISQHSQYHLEALALTMFGTPASMKLIEYGMNQVLQSCQSLTKLYFHSDLVSAQLCRIIAEKGSNLQELGLYPSFVVPASARDDATTMAYLPTLHHVRDLQLDVKQFPESLLSVLLECAVTLETRKLTLFNLGSRCAQIVAETIRRKGSNIKSIKLIDSEDIEMVLYVVARCCPRLEKLVITGAAAVEHLNLRDDIFHSLIAQCRELRHLDLPRQVLFTHRMLQSILELQPVHLEKLKIWGGVSHDFSQFASMCPTFRPLRTLQALKINAALSNEEIRIFCMAFPDIHYFMILDMDYEDSGASNASIRALEYVTQHCHHLRSFHFDFKSRDDDNDFKLYINHSMAIDGDCSFGWIGGGKNLNMYGYSALYVALPNFSRALLDKFFCVGKIQYYNALDELRSRLQRDPFAHENFRYEDVKTAFQALLKIHAINHYICGLGDQQRKAMKEKIWIPVTKANRPKDLVSMVQEVIDEVLES